MKLKKIAKIQSGYISRGKIESIDDGSHFLLQARDVDGKRLIYNADNLIRFSPGLSGKDWILEPNDVLFMARGARNYSILINEIPDNVLAAACFFIVRVTNSMVQPHYLFWYLNQEPVENYFRQHSGRGVHMPVVRRDVLENLDIPVPPVKVQAGIAKLDGLLRKEMELLHKLAENRKNLITAACLAAVRDNTGLRKVK
jgi:restriction endonuclease S subunit